MNVLIDLRWMKPGYTGGVEVLSRSFLDSLFKLDRSNHYTVLIPVEARYDFDLLGHDNFTFIASDGPGYFFHRLTEKLRLPWANARPGEIRYAGQRLQADIAISTPGYTHPDLLGLPTLVIVSDIQHEFFPEYFSTSELASRRAAFNTSIGSAQALCAISAYTRKTLTDRLGVLAEKVVVTPLAVDPLFERPAPPASDQNAVLRRYRLTPGFLYYPANTWPHKNHLALLDALAILRDEHGLTPALVCSGAAKEAQPEIERRITQLGLQNQVCFLGFVPREALLTLYRQAAALVFPSKFEGFGLPLIEAMSCGCPVASSNATSLPEVGGNAALYFDPDDSHDIAATIRRLLTDTELRAQMLQRGHQQAQAFSWLRFTRQVLSQAELAVNPTRPVNWLIQPLPPARPLSALQRLRRLHWRANLRTMQAAADHLKNRRIRPGIGRTMLALLLSPRATFGSLFFPLLRDRWWRRRNGHQV